MKNGIVFICYIYYWKLRLGILLIEIKNDLELNVLNDNDNDFVFILLIMFCRIIDIC